MVIIPRTQYMPYRDIDKKLKESIALAGPDIERVKTFQAKADEYYQVIKSGKIIHKEIICP
jgi:hypothetical protein